MLDRHSHGYAGEESEHTSLCFTSRLSDTLLSCPDFESIERKANTIIPACLKFVRSPVEIACPLAIRLSCQASANLSPCLIASSSKLGSRGWVASSQRSTQSQEIELACLCRPALLLP